ncbi:unnamed protein product [Orchesella dallaii]|uniref:poly(ADP-ribose) glycohydrolase n=1 Tax=Orchesella dallaii TaxID=48710 RepID=A0ABP1RU99_9HEXA
MGNSYRKSNKTARSQHKRRGSNTSQGLQRPRSHPPVYNSFGRKSKNPWQENSSSHGAFTATNNVQMQKPQSFVNESNNSQTNRPQSFPSSNLNNAQPPYANHTQHQLGPPEISKISAELAAKLENHQGHSCAPFYNQFNIDIVAKQQGGYTAQHDIKWNDAAFLRTTFSTNHVARGVNSPKNVYKWDVIQTWLMYLSNHCQNAKPPRPVELLMRTTIIKYDEGIEYKTDLRNLSQPDLAGYMTKTIPIIVYHSLKLPSLLASPIPFLKKHENKTIYLTKKLVCSLLANAFFCTLPEEKGGMQTINFHTMFNTAMKGNAKAEKLKCILNYFQEITKTLNDTTKGDQIISFERRCIRNKVDWYNSFKPLTVVEVDQNKKIEDAHGMLKVDFANKRVGGGVLSEGCVMEEILFATCPELIISRLFTEPLEDDEVLLITGSEQFSKYKGYSRSFSFAGPTKIHNMPTDNLNRVFNPVVVMDALEFKEHQKELQFQRHFVDRELHKAYVAFMLTDSVNIPVATGNWGCGAFNGDPELKFLIQWLAASETGRKLLVYHTIGSARQTESINSMKATLINKKVRVGDLYRIVILYDIKRNKCPSVFDYVKSQLSQN